MAETISKIFSLAQDHLFIFNSTKTTYHRNVFIRVMHLQCYIVENKAASSPISNYMIILWRLHLS